MSRKSQITGVGALAGNNVSHANNRSRRKQYPNLHSMKVFVPELGRSVKVKITTGELRTVDKIGLLAFLSANGKKLADVL